MAAVDAPVKRPLDVMSAFKHVEAGDIDALNSIISEDHVNIHHPSGHSLLHVAVKNGHTDIVKRLVELGSKIDDDSANQAQTPLHFAAQAGFCEIARILILEGADANAKDASGKTPKSVANERATLVAIENAEEEFVASVLKVTNLDTGTVAKPAEVSTPMPSTPLMDAQGAGGGGFDSTGLVHSGGYMPARIGSLDTMLPVGEKAIKNYIRENVAEGARRRLWLDITGASGMLRDKPDVYASAKAKTFRGTEQQANKLAKTMISQSIVPDFGGHALTRDHTLCEEAQYARARVLVTLAQVHPEVEFCPCLPDLVGVFLHIVGETEAFAMAHCLLGASKHAKSGAKWFLPRNKTIVALMAEGFRHCMEEWAGDADKLFRTARLDSAVLAGNWFNRLFVGAVPYPAVIRIVDCFLNEGNKVLYRFALAIMRDNTKALKVFVKTKQASVDEVERELARLSMTTSPHQLLASGFKLNRFGKKKLEAMMSLRKSGNTGSMFARAKATSFYLPNISGGGSLITHEHVMRLWSWLPERLKICDAALLFNSSKDGFNFNTFLNKVEFSGPSLLIIQSAEGSVFGGFASESWAVKKGFYGTGENFLFTLHPDPQAWHWNTEENDFHQQCDGKSLAMGGGVANGLYLDQSLASGTTNMCETYGNAPLNSGKRSFDAVHIEVYGLAVS